MSAAGAVSDRAYSPRFDGIAICSNAPPARSSDLKGPQSGWLGDLGMTHALPPQERPHEETCLFKTVGVVRADRTGPPGPAAKVHAIPAGCASKVTRASRDIVA